MASDAELTAWAGRAFGETQRLLRGTAARQLSGLTEVSWHGSSKDARTGAFALIDYSSGLDDLLGDVLRLENDGREVFVYVLGARDLDAPLSISRRAFMALGLLSCSSLECIVDVIA